MKKVKNILWSILMVPLFLLAACVSLTPTIVPPMTEELGYEIPNIKGITLHGIVKGKYKIEVAKMKLWKYTVDSTLQLTEEARGQIMDIITVIGLGGTAALPAALRRLPKGAAYKKEEEE